MKLKDYVNYWYETYKMPKHQGTTRHAYQCYINSHIVHNPIGEMEITEITLKDLQEYLANLKMYGKSDGTALSSWTVIKMRQILISVMGLAKKEKLIDYNIAEDTEPIPIPFGRKAIFMPEHQKAFLEATRRHRFFPAYVLLFYLGCRRSEILGLSWSNINFKRNELVICQALVMEGREIVLKPNTKTRGSIRTIPFPREIRTLLIEWRKKQKMESKTVPGWDNPDNLVFTNKDGSRHNPSYFSRNFKAMIKKLPFCDNSLHLHSTRHTWATNMIQLGAAITDVQAIGGWSRPDTLLNIYAQTVQKSQRRAINKLYKELSE